MSIGSVGSITASPMQQSLSVHSQPSSIPVNDQNIISPHQNDVSPHPLTPILENINNSGIKAENEDIKAGANANINMKNEEQFKNTLSKDGSDAMKNAKGGSLNTNSVLTKSGDSLPKENPLKRPALKIQECENNNEEDYAPNQSLYDYSTWDAW